VCRTRPRPRSRAPRPRSRRCRSSAPPIFGKDALAAYADLEHAVADSREQERDAARQRAGHAGAPRTSLFASWTADLESYSSPELRQQSQERLNLDPRALPGGRAGRQHGALPVRRRGQPAPLRPRAVLRARPQRRDALRSITAEVKALSGLTTTSTASSPTAAPPRNRLRRRLGPAHRLPWLPPPRASRRSRSPRAK
jgi:hypothetical protein